jgi:hypothetical protein
MRRGTLMIMIIVLILLPLAAFAGNIDSSAEPDDPSSAMYTLEDLYNRLDTGAEGTKRAGPFAEPGAGPTSSGYSVDAVMARAPQVDAADGAATAHVLFGLVRCCQRRSGVVFIDASPLPPTVASLQQVFAHRRSALYSQG